MLKDVNDSAEPFDLDLSDCRAVTGAIFYKFNPSYFSRAGNIEILKKFKHLRKLNLHGCMKLTGEKTRL